MHFWRLLLLSWVFSSSTLSAAPASDSLRNAQMGDYVVVIHGLGWFRDTLKPTVKYLNQRGYTPVRFTYDSRSPLLEMELVERIDTLIREQCPDPKRRIHFVAHSMGCIVTRLYLKHRQPKRLGRVVLLTPPNQGTELADLVGRSELLKEFFGKGASDLGTHAASLPNSLPAATYAPGIIMGNRSMFAPLSWYLQGPDDGVIRVERGKMPGMGGFIVVPSTHTRLPGASGALREMDHYLQTGKFSSGPQLAEIRS